MRSVYEVREFNQLCSKIISVMYCFVLFHVRDSHCIILILITCFRLPLPAGTSSMRMERLNPFASSQARALPSSPTPPGKLQRKPPQSSTTSCSSRAYA